MLLDRASERLGWPEPRKILKPKGAGPRIVCELAQEKLGRSLSRAAGYNVRVGVMYPDSTNPATEAPLAVICEFPTVPSNSTLNTAHRLAWNFSRSPLLITVDPVTVRAWTCCEVPSNSEGQTLTAGEIIPARLAWLDLSLSNQAAQSLHWINLASGRFFVDFSSRFRGEGRADQKLLSNLRAIRHLLHREHLSYPLIHDLLGRIIFIQFLFQRMDSSGRAALTENVLHKLHEEKLLSAKYRSLGPILRNYGDAYSFFKVLNEKFNGDLFPGKGDNDRARESEWQQEMKQVTSRHLTLLADFVDGTLSFESGQGSLFPLYSFDTIPLEFISSIYEEFVTAGEEPTGTHYTPGHLVDFLLDGVLPWDDDDWNLKILDPACGSGIFLVKAYQRLIHRWKRNHPHQEVSPAVLRGLLERNLFGIDINSEAIRVASFSLYLAMCDEIDPRHYWTRVRFPRLRGSQLRDADFFANDDRTGVQVESYDLVVGNAPWGKATITENARQWSNRANWRTPYGSIGPLFLVRAAQLAKPSGSVSMLQSLSFVVNAVGTARKFQQKFFSTYKVEEVTNLSALRFGLFENAIAPTCIITLCPQPPDGEYISYVCPKPSSTSLDDYRLVIESQDIHQLSPSEAAGDSRIWTTLMWGDRRNLRLLDRLSDCLTIEKLSTQSHAHTREGIVRGNRARRADALLGRPFLDTPVKGNSVFLDPSELPVNSDPFVHSRDSTAFEAFEPPQMLIKQGWRKESGRFQALLVAATAKEGVLCTQSYITVHVEKEYRNLLETACLTYNSIFAVYFLMLTSGRFASYRPEPTVSDLLKLPLPKPHEDPIDEPQNYEDLDHHVRTLFGFKDSEWALVEDIFDYTLPDFKGDEFSPGRRCTRRSAQVTAGKSEMERYCEVFIQVLKAGFGETKPVSATVFEEPSNALLPVRLVAIHLDRMDSVTTINFEQTNSSDLWDRLRKINEELIVNSNSQGPHIFSKRIVRVYDTVRHEGRRIPTVYLVKPDQIRYWTRTMAMRDADAVAVDIMCWRTQSPDAKKAIGRGR